MPRVASGAITITDVLDGASPISIILSNENHTFPADTDGSVAAGDFDDYTTSVTVFEGTSELVFNNTATTDAALSNSSYRLAKNSGDNTDRIEATGSGFPAGSTYVITKTGNKAIVTGPNTALAASSADSGFIDINIRVKNAGGTVSLVTLRVSYTKAIIGAGGDIVQLDIDKQSFTADSAGTYDPSSQTDIIVNIFTQGAPGAQRYFISENGGGFTQVTTAANTKGKIKGFDTDRTGTFTTTGTISTAAQRLTLSTANLGTNDTMVLRVTGSTDSKGNDVVSIIKVRTGATGASSLIIVVESSGSTTFSSGDQTAKTLTARVYDAGTGSEITSGVTYDWRLGDTTAAAKVKINNATNRLVQASGIDAVTQTIVVGPEDVTNSQQYSVIVNTTT